MVRMRSRGKHGAAAGRRPPPGPGGRSPREPGDPLLDAAVQAVIRAAGGQGRDGTVRGQPRDLAIAVLRLAGGEIGRLRAVIRQLESCPPPAAGASAGPSATLEEARDVTVSVAAAARRMLDEHGAPNFVELEVTDDRTGQRYLVIYVRPGGRTPLELLAEAEDRARDAERRLAAALRPGAVPGGFPAALAEGA